MKNLSVAVEQRALVCQCCEQTIYKCAICDDYINDDDEIICDTDTNKHYHKSCEEMTK